MRAVNVLLVALVILAGAGFGRLLVWLVFDEPPTNDPAVPISVDATPTSAEEAPLEAVQSTEIGEVRFGDSRYEFVPSPGLDWASAALLADARGGHLPRIESPEENEFISTTFARGSSIWLDIRDESGDGDWRGTDGARPSYVNWLSGQPDYEEPAGPYYARMGSHDGRWADNGGVTGFFFVDQRWLDVPIRTVIEYNDAPPTEPTAP